MLGMVLFHICVRNLPPAVQNLWISHYRDARSWRSDLSKEWSAVVP